MCGETVSTGLHSPPVLPTGEGYGRYRVHDALVVSSGAKRVGFGEVICLQYSLYDFGALLRIALVRQFLRTEYSTHPSQSVHGKIADYAQYNCPTCHTLYLWGDGLGHGVDSVCTHGVSTVHQDVDNDHRSGVSFYYSDLNIPTSATEFD